MQQLGEGFHVVAMTGEAGLQVVQVPHQPTFNEFRGERCLPDLMPCLQRASEVVLDRERDGQAAGEQRERGVPQNALARLGRGVLRTDRPRWSSSSPVFGKNLLARPIVRI
jgi:hypothetical protein